MLFKIIITLTTCLNYCISHPLSMPNYRNHPCIRTCQMNFPMTCEYNFTAEYYYTMSKACHDCPFNVSSCQRPECVTADGNPRTVIVINRMLPGPGIHVCEGDNVVVTLHNKLISDGMSIHWHGILQHGSPHMDGVSMLTQCPIPGYTSFQYRFTANNAGTLFWHSHSGLQRSDGVFGALIVRQAAEREVHYGLYDYDLPQHTVVINDWLKGIAIGRFANHHQAYGDNRPSSILINGKGAHRIFYNSNTNENITTPYEVFHVERGRRYRFRIISNGILNCPIQFSVDNHILRVIASDGAPFNFIDVESINIFAGERYDVVILADQAEGNYWIRARGDGDCTFKNAFQQAILRYNGSREKHPRQPTGYEFGNRQGKQLNPFNKKGTELLIPVIELQNTQQHDEALKNEPDKKFYLSMDFNQVDDYDFYVGPDFVLPPTLGKYETLLIPQINHISTTLPPSPPLTQFEDIPQEIFCNPDTVKKNCSAEFCKCVYTLKVDLNDTVELIIIDEGKTFDANHPMHLHGYTFRVVGMDKLSNSTTLEEVKALDRAGNLSRNLLDPVSKDTVTVPDGGYVILRIHAINPGFWFMHCHIEFHAEIGMGFVLQVGEPHQMPKAPLNFPRCGSWKYTKDEIDEPFYPTSAAISPIAKIHIHVLAFVILILLLISMMSI